MSSLDKARTESSRLAPRLKTDDRKCTTFLLLLVSLGGESASGNATVLPFVVLRAVSMSIGEELVTLIEGSGGLAFRWRGDCCRAATVSFRTIRVGILCEYMSR